MRLAELPPAGERVELGEQQPLPTFPGYRQAWLQSGTAALALALIHARKRRSAVAAPEVVIPAYGCPDLVAAAVYAGLRPVLADIGDWDPGYDLGALQSAVNGNTVAVIAVNFLGIRERLDIIQTLLPDGIALVEDDAQWYPEPGGVNNLSGDYVITSFGRGKPASVLAGGLLLIRNELCLDERGPSEHWLSSRIKPAETTRWQALRYRSKVRMYNVLRRPALYFWLSRNPFLRLGETRYKPLTGIEAIQRHCQAIVACNAGRHVERSRWREAYYDQLLVGAAAVEPLHISCAGRSGRLLRYPLICQTKQQRDRLLQALKTQGLGASAMYQRPLMEIPGLATTVLSGAYPQQAKHFADRLLTLPVHADVTRTHMANMAAIIHDTPAAVGSTQGTESNNNQSSYQVPR